MRAELHSLLAAIRRRWLTLVAARTGGRALIAAAVPLAAAAGVDLLLAPRGAAAILLGVVTVAASAGAAAVVLWRMRHRPDDRQLARFIEEQVGHRNGVAPLGDEVVTAVDAASSVASGGFADMVIARAVARLRDIPPALVVPSESLRRAVLEGVTGCVVFTLAAIPGHAPLSRALETARLLLVPGSIHVQVVPGNARVPVGQAFRIHASLQGGDAALQRLAPSLTVSAGSGRRTVPMTRQGDSFLFVFDSVDRSFRYRVTAGAATSDEFSVTALVPPRVRRIDARYVYPPFTGLSARTEEGAGDLYAPAGTRVHLRVYTDRPVRSGELAFGRSSPASLRASADTLLEGDIVLSSEDSYRVRLADRDGVRTDGDTEYFIRLVDDRPPDVRIMRPAADQPITPLEEVPIEARADDDYGIERFDLVYSVAGQKEHVVSFGRVTGTAVEKLGSLLLLAEDLHVRPGDVITYYARARDVARGKASTEVKSDIFFLEVKPFNQEFESAESQATTGAAGTQIDALIAAQKEIINATWNLERRAAAGRSAADLKSVATAQAELKQRAGQMAGRSSSRRGSRERQQVVTPRGSTMASEDRGDPVSAAIEAMALALRQLEAQRTGEAIPHEMAALQGLLRAQAEERRRQVTQQRAGSGSGSGRQGEDLSALFDKELQRQQRTNYENRAQVEETPQQQTDASASDRVRDLAKRQEELSRRQRALANATVSEDERKRQLEKLTREQNELRDEAERLARQMTQGRQEGVRQQDRAGEGQGVQQGRSSQGSEQSSSQAGGSSEIKSASDQMRAAASDLQRQDPTAAAGNSARAAEQLRKLEDQLNAGSAGSRQRAAGELRLEAQQIAEGQRRVAREAERLGQSAGDADARRRLAADKERLADRVDALQQAAEQFAKQDRTGTAARGATEAAHELAQQRLGEKMRESAKAMRNAPGPSGTANQAATEQQIARAMDRVVDKLGGTTGDPSQALGGELDRSREIRDRLNGLERRIRETEAKLREAAGRSGDGTKAGTGGRRGLQDELQRLQDEYGRELQQARQAFAPNARGEQRSGTGASTPEQEEFSRSAPGTEAFKNDFSNWDNLRKEVDLALERYEAAASARVQTKDGKDRLNGGGSDRVPDGYREMIARYYESIAKAKK
jgi:hypothetical protein